MKINLVCVGNIKDRFYAEACEEYKKRLSRFCSLCVVEVPECVFCGQPNERERELLLEEEYNRYRKHLKGHLVALDAEGKGMPSEDFSRYLMERKAQGEQMTFLIGGSHGLCGRAKEQAHLRLSFSRMTFPHTLFRVMLLEQLYRAFMIAGGGRYHK